METAMKDKMFLVGLAKNSKSYEIFKQRKFDKKLDDGYEQLSYYDLTNMLNEMQSETMENLINDRIDYDRDLLSWSNNGAWEQVRNFVRDKCCFNDEQYWPAYYMSRTVDEMDHKVVFVVVLMRKIIYTDKPNKIKIMKYNIPDVLSQSPNESGIEPIYEIKEGSKRFDEMYLVVRRNNTSLVKSFD